MWYLLAIFISLGLFGGFLVLTEREQRRGERFRAHEREILDKKVAWLEFVLAHVDFWSLAWTEVRGFVHQIGHIAAHGLLQAVRYVERLLTRLVRHLHLHHETMLAPGENTREFVKTLSDFKGHLKETRPEVPHIL